MFVCLNAAPQVVQVGEHVNPQLRRQLHDGEKAGRSLSPLATAFPMVHKKAG